MADVIIAGSGPAGLTAGLYTSRAGLKTIVVSGTLPGGQLTRTGVVENFPGCPDGVDGSALMERMRDQALKYGAGMEYDEIASAELADGGIQRVTAASGTKFEAPVLIIATGAEPRWPGLPGEEKFRNHGLSVCAACDGHFYRDQDVAVVGGGDSALEEALSLATIASSVTLIHRRDSFRSSGIMAERVMSTPDIRILWHTIIVGMEGDGRLEALRLRDAGDGSETVIRVRALFSALGHRGIRSAAGGGPGRLHHNPFSGGRNFSGRGFCRRGLRRQPLPAGGHRRRGRVHGGDERGAVSSEAEVDKGIVGRSAEECQGNHEYRQRRDIPGDAFQPAGAIAPEPPESRQHGDESEDQRQRFRRVHGHGADSGSAAAAEHPDHVLPTPAQRRHAEYHYAEHVGQEEVEMLADRRDFVLPVAVSGNPLQHHE